MLHQQQGVGQQQGVDQQMDHKGESAKIDGKHERGQSADDERDQDASPTAASVDRGERHASHRSRCHLRSVHPRRISDVGAKGEHRCGYRTSLGQTGMHRPYGSTHPPTRSTPVAELATTRSADQRRYKKGSPSGSQDHKQHRCHQSLRSLTIEMVNHGQVPAGEWSCFTHLSRANERIVTICRRTLQ